jgi:hypothetical protein
MLTRKLVLDDYSPSANFILSLQNISLMATTERIEKRGSAATVRVSASSLPYTSKASVGSVPTTQVVAVPSPTSHNIFSSINTLDYTY